MKEIILKMLKTFIIICITLVFSLTLLRYGFSKYYQYEKINNPGVYLHFKDFKGPISPENENYKFKEEVKKFDNDPELRILIIITSWIITSYLSFKEWERL